MCETKYVVLKINTLFRYIHSFANEQNLYLYIKLVQPVFTMQSQESAV